MSKPETQAALEKLYINRGMRPISVVRALVDVGLAVCKFPDEHPNNDNGYQRGQRDLLASILKKAGLL